MREPFLDEYASRVDAPHCPLVRSSYHEAQTKYLPTHREAVTGYHFPAKEYGYGDHAHPTLERSGYGNDFTDISAVKRYAGVGGDGVREPYSTNRFNKAFSTPRTGVF